MIADNYNPEKIILFGSHAYGKPTKKSDIDLLVVKDSNLPRYKRARELRKYLWGIAETPMDILVYTPKEIAEWKNVKESFITRIITNGHLVYENKG
ncbi:MAG: hypothetical protein MSIBF_01065 [Candidatus Altiarchaeales archaeon IMC4]|nr:MAG: hypothetical protein MSIBF_01065 [Candidatus Altiarchaeales archaeon IMC4]